MMSNKNPPIEQSQIVEYAGLIIQQKSKLHLNLEQDFILTTEDKVLICLTKHLSRMENKKAWWTPLGILLTILVVFPTTNFQPFLFMSADGWMALFLFFGILSIAWLIYAYSQSRVSTSINEVVGEIKKTAIITEQPQSEIVPTSLKSEAVSSDDLVIRSATYGAKDSQIDVTQILNSNIKDGKLELSVRNENLGDDPIYGEVKKLEVEYSYAGDIHKRVVNEKDVLTLP